MICCGLALGRIPTLWESVADAALRPCPPAGRGRGCRSATTSTNNFGMHRRGSGCTAKIFPSSGITPQGHDTQAAAEALVGLDCARASSSILIQGKT